MALCPGGAAEAADGQLRAEVGEKWADLTGCGGRLVRGFLGTLALGVGVSKSRLCISDLSLLLLQIPVSYATKPFMGICASSWVPENSQVSVRLLPQMSGHRVVYLQPHSGLSDGSYR